MLSQASNLSWEKCLSHWWIKISFVFSGGRNFPQLLIREQILLFYLNLLYVTSNPPKKHQFPRVILILSSYVKKLRKVQKNTKHQVINYLKYACLVHDHSFIKTLYYSFSLSEPITDMSSGVKAEEHMVYLKKKYCLP